MNPHQTKLITGKIYIFTYLIMIQINYSLTFNVPMFTQTNIAPYTHALLIGFPIFIVLIVQYHYLYKIYYTIYNYL